MFYSGFDIGILALRHLCDDTADLFSFAFAFPSAHSEAALIWMAGHQDGLAKELRNSDDQAVTRNLVMNFHSYCCRSTNSEMLQPRDPQPRSDFGTVGFDGVG